MCLYIPPIPVCLCAPLCVCVSLPVYVCMRMCVCKMMAIWAEGCTKAVCYCHRGRDTSCRRERGGGDEGGDKVDLWGYVMALYAVYYCAVPVLKFSSHPASLSLYGRMKPSTVRTDSLSLSLSAFFLSFFKKYIIYL